MHAIWRPSSIRTCCYCFAAAVVAFLPRVPRFSDPHSQVAKTRTIKDGWEFNCVLREESNMQEGSVIREHRKLGPDVWSYRWWESRPNGNRVHRRIVLGTAELLRDLSSARQMTSGLKREINATDIRMAGTSITVAQLADHFQQRELGCSNARTDESRTPPRRLIRVTLANRSFRVGETTSSRTSKLSKWSYGSNICNGHRVPAAKSGT